MNETHCSYGYYQDTSEYVKKIGGHHASFNATPPRQICQKASFLEHLLII